MATRPQASPDTSGSNPRRVAWGGPSLFVQSRLTEAEWYEAGFQREFRLGEIELEIIRAWQRELVDWQVQNFLGMSRNAYCRHRARIFAALGVKSKIGACMKAARRMVGVFEE